MDFIFFSYNFSADKKSGFIVASEFYSSYIFFSTSIYNILINLYDYYRNVCFQLVLTVINKISTRLNEFEKNVFDEYNIIIIY